MPEQFIEIIEKGEKLADKGQEGPSEVLFARE